MLIQTHNPSEESSMRWYLKTYRYNGSFERWIGRLVVLGKIDNDDWHRECGKYSGYPKCCIEWFVFVFTKLHLPVGTYTAKIWGEDIENIGYVRCPNCRKISNGRR